MNTNCLATELMIFENPRITSIQLFNHIEKQKEIKKGLN